MKKKEEKIEKVPDEVIKKEIQEILKGGYPEEATATLGENRGQLFIRIPKIVKNRLNLKKGDKLHFKVYTDHKKKTQLEVNKV